MTEESKPVPTEPVQPTKEQQLATAFSQALNLIVREVNLLYAEVARITKS